MPRDSFLLWLAQGFGSGRSPWAPGTFGSLVGIVWTWLLLATGSLVWFLGGTVIALAAAVWICGQAERILQDHDPGCVVLDEIAALPVCFLPLAVMEVILHGQLRPVEHFGPRNVALTLAVGFALFRLFDIWKPGPIRHAQRLPGGLGVVADDFFAALAVALVLPWLTLAAQRLLS
jgi:phosphatidylglycerophosphatase A